MCFPCDFRSKRGCTAREETKNKHLEFLAFLLTSLVLHLSPNPFAASEIGFWMMGSLAGRSMTHVWLALPFMVIGCGLQLLWASGLGGAAMLLAADIPVRIVLPERDL